MEPYTIELQRSQHCANTLVLARKLSEALEGFIHAEQRIDIDPLSIGDGLARAMSLVEEKVLKPHVLIQQRHSLQEAIRLEKELEAGADTLVYRGQHIQILSVGIMRVISQTEETSIPDAMSIIDKYLTRESESVQW